MSNFKKDNNINLTKEAFWLVFNLSFAFISIYIMSVFFKNGFIVNMVNFDLNTLKPNPRNFFVVALYYSTILIPISFFFIKMFHLIRELIINRFTNKLQERKKRRHYE
jgi:hypothetical protein